MREGDAKDVPFVGYKLDHPRALFYVNSNTFVGYFVVVRPADGDPKLF